MKRSVLVLVACITLTSCHRASPTAPSGPMEGWAWIASVGGLDAITHAHLCSLINAHGIECVIEGSVVYGVAVPTDKRAEAISLIKDDLRERQYDITLHGDGKDLKYEIPERNWHTTEPKMTYTDLIKRHDCAPSTDLGAWLRTADVVNDVPCFRYVLRIKALERQYLDTNRTVQVGHQFAIEFAVSADEQIGGKRLYFQVWDHGKQVEPLGADERWHGSVREIAANKRKYDKRKSEEPPDQVPEDTVHKLTDPQH